MFAATFATPQSNYCCSKDIVLSNECILDWVSVKLPLLVGYPFAALLVVAGLGIVLHGKWLELQLLYRSHFQLGKHDRGENAHIQDKALQQ